MGTKLWSGTQNVIKGEPATLLCMQCAVGVEAATRPLPCPTDQTIRRDNSLALMKAD